MYGEHFRTSNIIVTTIPTERMPKTAPITRAILSSASGMEKKERNKMKYVFFIFLLCVCIRWIICRPIITTYFILTRFYHKYLRIGVTTVSKRPHSDVVPCIRIKRPVAIYPFIHVGRDLLAVNVLPDRILDGFYEAVISNVIR